MSLAMSENQAFLGTLQGFRQKFRERWAWFLLPALFAICFIIPNRTGATNLYRLFIVLPMIACFRFEDARKMWGLAPVRWILWLFAWMSLTLLWDGWSEKDLNLLLRELNVLAFFYLVYLVCRFQSQKLPIIYNSFLIIGFIGALLIIKDWQGIQSINTDWQHTESARGIFNHHLEVGWIMACLGILSFYGFLNDSNKVPMALYFMGFVFFALLTFFVQARGGYVVMGVGITLCLLVVRSKRGYLLALGGLAGIILIAILFYQEASILLEKAVSRGDAGRLLIWQNGLSAIFETPLTALFGHGLSGSTQNNIGNFVAAHYHSFYLNQVFYTGFFGFGLYCIALFSLFGRVFVRKVFAQSAMLPWGIVLFSMQFGFLTDGDRLFVNPSSTLLCVLMPIALVMFMNQHSAVNKQNVN